MTQGQKKTLLRIVLAGLMLPPAAYLGGAAGLALYVAAYLVVGCDVVLAALRNIAQGEVFDERFLMALATAGAFAIGEYAEAAGVMLFYQTGELFQSLAVGRTRRSIAKLMDIRPDAAVVERGGEELRVKPEEVLPGEVIVVRPGERIPLDGEILEGNASVDASALTGESLPEDRAPGDRVLSGSIDLNGLLRIRVESSYAESTVARILELTENAALRKARTERFITRFARYYTPCVVLGAALLAVLPPLLFSWAWSESVYRSLVFLMVSCPCALVISVPLGFFSGLGRASREGILVKGANDLEALSRLDGMVFDKTGTLTRGAFHVREVHTEEGITAAELLGLAAAVERSSNHPVAAAIRAAAEPELVRAHSVTAVLEHAGSGVEAELAGERCFVGSARLMERAGAGTPRDAAPDTGTAVHVARGGRYLGRILVDDELKPEAEEALSSLRALGLGRLVMLTGDSSAAAGAVAERLGLDAYRAELLPDRKLGELETLLSEGQRLAFVGDGINDAPVLSRADVGIAMGELGSDAALEAADIVIMDDDLRRLPRAVELSRRTMRIVRQNIVLALAVKGIILLLGAFGEVGLWGAVFGDVGVMVLAVLNAIR